MGAAYDTAVLADSPQGFWHLSERENLVLQSESLSNAAWTQPSGSVTITGGVESTSFGGQSVSIDEVTFSTGSVLRQTGMATSAAATVSMWARCPSGTAFISVTLRGGLKLTLPLDKVLRRYEFPCPNAASNANLDISGTTGVAIRIGGIQINYGGIASGYTKTTSAVVNPTTFADSSGNARHLTRGLPTGNGGVAYTMGVSFSPDPNDFALDFAGLSTNPQIYNTGTVWNRAVGAALSIEVWLKPRFPGSWAEIVWNNNNSNQNNWGLRLDGQANTLGVFSGMNAAINTAVTGWTYKPQDNEWNHYVVVVDTSGQVTMYRNGVGVFGPATINAWIAATTPGQLDVGSIRGPDGSLTIQLFRGSMYGLAIYGTALTSTQVQNHYNAMPVVERTASTPNLPGKDANAPFAFAGGPLVGQPTASGPPNVAGKGKRRVINDSVDGW
jgi:hypothetical protein